MAFTHSLPVLHLRSLYTMHGHIRSRTRRNRTSRAYRLFLAIFPSFHILHLQSTSPFRALALRALNTVYHDHIYYSWPLRSQNSGSYQFSVACLLPLTQIQGIPYLQCIYTLRGLSPPALEEYMHSAWPSLFSSRTVLQSISTLPSDNRHWYLTSSKLRSTLPVSAQLYNTHHPRVRWRRFPVIRKLRHRYQPSVLPLQTTTPRRP